MTEFLKFAHTEEAHGEDYPRLKNLMGLSYISLLESIAENDRSSINQVCEQNLYKAFAEGLSDLNYSIKEI